MPHTAFCCSSSLQSTRYTAAPRFVRTNHHQFEITWFTLRPLDEILWLLLLVLIHSKSSVSGPPGIEVYSQSGSKNPKSPQHQRHVLLREDPSFSFQMLLFRLLFAKNVNLWFQFTWMLWFPTQNCDDGIREPLGFPTGLTCFFFQKLDKLTEVRANIWIWKVVLLQLIRNNRVWDSGIDHGKRFFNSFIPAGLFLELFVQTKIREIFIILSKMADIGRFWTVLEVFFLMHCGVTT